MFIAGLSMNKEMVKDLYLDIVRWSADYSHRITTSYRMDSIHDRLRAAITYKKIKKSGRLISRDFEYIPSSDIAVAN